VRLGYTYVVVGHNLRFRAYMALAGAHGRPLGRRLHRVSRFVDNAYFNRGTYDLRTDGELSALQRLAGVHRGPRHALDVGANVGEWSAALLATILGATVDAFEPVSSTRRRLEEALRAPAGAGRARIWPLGVGDASGTATIHVPHPGSPLATLTDRHDAATSVVEEIDVTTIDAFCATHGVDHVHVLKVDTEGWDHLVLAGAADMLTGGKIDVVQFEYGPWALESRFLLLDFYDLLEAHGFVVGKIYPRGVEFGPYEAELEDFHGANYLGVRRHLVEVRRALAGVFAA